MKPSLPVTGLAFLSLCLSIAFTTKAQETLPGTKALTREGDLSAQMVEGIDRWLLREIEQSVERRKQYWQRDLSSPEAYSKSVGPNRDRLRQIIGVVDQRVPMTGMELVATTSNPALVADKERWTVQAVRWPVLEGVHGEGLLVQPKGEIKARVVLLPDADMTPEEMLGLKGGRQSVWHLADNGFQILIPTLISRSDEFSGSERLGLFTNQPHREWIYRQAFEMGRHIIGYEVQKVLAAVDWFSQGAPPAGSARIGVVGYGEGGLIALHAAALDTRIEAALVSGYFGPRQGVWAEPIYRNVFGLLREFGDAEIASLIAPRSLVIEQSETPKISGPPQARQGRRGGAAPGVMVTPDLDAVRKEVDRAGRLGGKTPLLIASVEGKGEQAISFAALKEFYHALTQRELGPQLSSQPLADLRADFKPEDRQRRQLKELESHVQNLLRVATYEREKTFWAQLKAKDAAAWDLERKAWQTSFRDSVMGRFPPPSEPVNAQSRKVLETDKVTGWDVTLDVWPDVFAWGVLLLPKDIKPGERRPVVVCQHGLEGVPMDTIMDDPKSRAYAAYKAYSLRLAERGFVVFAPHNPYRGQDKFRTLQRKANALGGHLFSFIFAQHERILDWLGGQPFVDPRRIAFYGLSYGGKSAMRIPAVLDRYCLSICSADFNEWVWKNATVDWRGSYLYTGEYEIFEWNLGHTFNYAEMAALIAPRPFMVERGHDDGVGIDEWVNFEFAKVRRFYTKLGIGGRTEIEHFNGPHTINGRGTFDFLHRHLDWPER
jgi:dienelactone hydrolase